MREFRIETERCVLREWRGDADWDDFFFHTNTIDGMKWLGGVLDDDGMAATRARVEACEAKNGFCFWLVERKMDGGAMEGEVLGFCGLKRADAPGSSITGEVEIGWRFRKDVWGRGLAREASEAAMEAGFEQFGAETIYSITVEGNEPSWGLMKRLGMQRREDLDYEDERFEDPWRENIVYSISREEWRAHTEEQDG